MSVMVAWRDLRLGDLIPKIRAGSGQARGDFETDDLGPDRGISHAIAHAVPEDFPPTTSRSRSTVCDWLDQSVKSREGDTPSQTHTVREVCCSKNRRYKHVAAVPTVLTLVESASSPSLLEVGPFEDKEGRQHLGFIEYHGQCELQQPDWVVTGGQAGVARPVKR